MVNALLKIDSERGQPSIMDDCLACSVCWEEYRLESDAGRPRSLPCGHTVCTRCLGKDNPSNFPTGAAYICYEISTIKICLLQETYWTSRTIPLALSVGKESRATSDLVTFLAILRLKSWSTTASNSRTVSCCA